MKKQKTKKVLAMLLAVSLLMPMLPILPGMSTTVYAEGTNVTQFATLAELVDSNKFSLDGSKPGSAQAIYFGQNSSSVPQKQKWYIAGADTNDGLVLMCDVANPLAMGQQYGDEQPYGEDWGCTYDLSGVPTTVYANHYGGSALRAALKALEKNTAYFSPSEQKLMQETTITTNDTKNQTTYTTTDKLYAAYGDTFDSMYITVGTNAAGNLNGGLKIDLTGGSPYATGGIFWLRSPYDSDGCRALLALPGNYVGSFRVDDGIAVVPAFHLNLSSVLFASAAPAASSEGALKTEDAMTLRYMPTPDKSLGTAAINSAQNSVSVSGAPEETYLVVQNGSGAWAKAVSGATSVSVSEVEIGNHGLTSFADCKVWLETTDVTDRITTAVMAVQGHETKITNPLGSHITRSTEEGNGAETQIDAPGTAITDVVYTADSGYYFPVNYSVTKVNGISVTRNSLTQITVSGTPTADAAITLAAATAKEEQIAPVGLSDGIGKIDGTKTAMEYAAAADATKWTTCTEGTTEVAAGIWYVRYKETDTKKASPVTEIIVSAPSYTITTDPAALNFGTVNQDDKGSYTQPDAQTVTVTNTGNSEVTENFTVKAKPEDAPKVIKGADSKWTKGSKDGLSFTSNAEFDKFKKVMIDGKDIDASHYDVQSESTIVTLKAEYLETLKAGKHTISIVSENGTADAAFTIVKGADKPAPDKQAPNKQTPSENGKSTKVPQIGDNCNLALWLILLALCGGTIAAISIRKKRS